MLPIAVTGLCVYSTINALSLRINWSGLNGISSYSLYESEIPHDEFVLVSSGIPGLTYYHNPQSTNLSLNLRNRWYYKVSATNAFGEGPLSAPSTSDPYGELVDQPYPTPGLSYWNLL